MMQKKETRPPILYERYKRMKNNEAIALAVPKKEKRRWTCRIGNIIITAILLGMTVLSVIGTVTLLQPQMRLLLQEILGC